MKVKLISHTPEPEKTCALAARACHEEKLPLRKKAAKKDIEKIIRIVRDSGHLSVFEHANFTFGVEGVSRALTHQLVRHRLASYSQQSQRYVNLDKFEYVTPHTIEKSKEASQVYQIIMKNLADGYKRLEKMGVPIEDARYILPNATHTNIVITMNARELDHFFTLRCCKRAQWEIQEMANLMLKECKKAAPTIFKKSGPACNRGPCPEGQFSCKKGGKIGE